VVVMNYYLINLNKDPDFIYNMLSSYFFIYIGSVFAGQTFSAILSTLGDTMEQVSSLTPLVLLPMLLTTGYLGNLQLSNVIIQVLAYFSPIRFAFQGITLTEFQNRDTYINNCNMTIPCPQDPSRKCVVPVPDKGRAQCDPMNVIDPMQTTIVENGLYVISLVVLFRIISYITLKIKSNTGKMKYKKNQFLSAIYQTRKTHMIIPTKSGLDPLNQLDSFVKDTLNNDDDDEE
jgi:hypothetical protein